MTTETAVYAYYWGFGPLRWAFTERAISRDRQAVAGEHPHTWGAIGPIQEMLLEELPPEPEFRLYVG